MGFWNSITKIGRKAWSAGKGLISDVYKPVKSIVHTIHKGANFVDGLLNKAVDIGIPSSLVDIIRNNPIYSTIQGTINTVDDLVEKDLPRFGNVVNDFVEHNVLSKTAPQNVGNIIEQGRDVLQQGRELGEQFGRRLPNREAFGFTPSRQPTSRQFIPAGSSVG